MKTNACDEPSVKNRLTKLNNMDFLQTGFAQRNSSQKY
jgi:hypothetical protein